MENLNLSIDLKNNSTSIKCESCDGETFIEVVYLRKISKILTGGHSDSIAPIPAFQCSKCGHINTEFTPKI
jgi:uncharacterized Zn finger protein